MKWDAKYTFKVSPFSGGERFLFSEHTGIWIPDFTPELITPLWTYSILKGMGGKRYPCIRIIGPYPPLELNYIPEMADFAYGVFNDYVVLVKFERDRTKVSRIKIWFSKKTGIAAKEFYEQWISCQFELD